MQLPPSVTCALLSPLAKLDIQAVNATWDGGADLEVIPRVGPMQEPIKELCEMHPEICSLVEKFREYLVRTQSASHLYHQVRDAALKKCTEASESVLQKGGDRDSLGYRYVPDSCMPLWLVSGVIALALSFALTFGSQLLAMF